MKPTKPLETTGEFTVRVNGAPTILPNGAPATGLPEGAAWRCFMDSLNAGRVELLRGAHRMAWFPPFETLTDGVYR